MSPRLESFLIFLLFLIHVKRIEHGNALNKGVYIIIIVIILLNNKQFFHLISDSVTGIICLSLFKNL